MALPSIPHNSQSEFARFNIFSLIAFFRICFLFRRLLKANNHERQFLVLLIRLCISDRFSFPAGNGEPCCTTTIRRMATS